MSEELTLFRIHLNDGSSIDKHAMSPAEARAKAKDEIAARGTTIRKTKAVKGGHDGR